jgi:opacity protein-like surface antigen
MRSEFKLAAVAAALVAMPVVGAQAQQFVAPIVDSTMYQPAPAAWDGFYLGAQGSIVAMKSHEIGTLVPTEQLLGDIGGSAGVFAGYRYQLNDWFVLGLDGEFNNVATELLYPGTVYGAMKWDAAVRATLGYPVAPNVLAYGTAGYSWAHFDLTPFYGASDSTYTAGGFQLGLGVDVMVTQNIMARLNATWTHYGVNTVKQNGTNIGTSEPSDVVVRAGLAYKF